MVTALAERYRVPVASVTLRDRAQYAQALDQGRGITEKSVRSIAAREIDDLFAWLQRHDARVAKATRKVTA